MYNINKQNDNTTYIQNETDYQIKPNLGKSTGLKYDNDFTFNNMIDFRFMFFFSNQHNSWLKLVYPAKVKYLGLLRRNDVFHLSSLKNLSETRRNTCCVKSIATEERP